jgi:stage IV sporulation protein A
MDSLELDPWLKRGLIDGIRSNLDGVYRLRDIESAVEGFVSNENINRTQITDMQMGEGVINITISLKEGLFFRIIGEVSGYDVNGDYQLISLVRDLAQSKREYDKVRDALKDVKEFGYGMVAPSVEEIRLEEPEIAKQGNKFGVKLRASAPSLHIIRCDIETEIAPIIGTEKQSEEFIRYFMEEFENNPQKIWESNMFGKSLYDMVKEELQGKLYKMPDDIQGKLQLTLQKVVNDSKGGIICIII